eukprot:1447376-Rhodomonas_salina.2
MQVPTPNPNACGAHWASCHDLCRRLAAILGSSPRVVGGRRARCVTAERVKQAAAKSEEDKSVQTEAEALLKKLKL